MQLKIKRQVLTPKSTIGLLLVDNQFECYTLEDVVRDPGIKIQNETAIPSGNYQVILDFSKRFQRIMPLLVNVPGFQGIRIHNGNTDKDTDGCILVGRKKGEDFIGESRLAFEMLFKKLSDTKGEIKLEIGS